MSILAQVPTKAKIRAVIVESTFGKRLSCPRCGSTRIKRSEHRYRCPKCRRPFSLTSVSWLSSMKISLQQFWLLLLCWQKRIAFATTQEITGLSAITVRRWFRRFQTHLVYESPILQGFVEVDEAFVGRRRHGNQRIVLGAYERERKKVVLRVTTSRDQDTTDVFLLKHVKTSSHVYTDGAMCYEGIDAFFGYKHEWCNHSEYEFGPTNHIENVWSRLKRYIRRTYHHYHRGWLPKLVREFEARINAPELFKSPHIYLLTSLFVVPTR